jgi:putative transcriptional regulator
MKRELFEELLESLREAAAITRGELGPAAITRFPAVDTRAIRESFGATQLEFSRTIGVSLATLRNWEQGRRRPQGPARILLLVVAKHPHVVRRVIAEYRVAAVTKAFSKPKRLRPQAVKGGHDTNGRAPR